MYKPYSFGGEGDQWKKTLILYTFKILTHFLSFSWRILHLKNVDEYTFGGGGRSEKEYGLYTDFNVDNYGCLPTNVHYGYIIPKQGF